MHLYCPGDDQIDFAGVDGYDFGDGCDERRENRPNWPIEVSASSLRTFNETFASKKKPAGAVPRSGGD